MPDVVALRESNHAVFIDRDAEVFRAAGHADNIVTVHGEHDLIALADAIAIVAHVVCISSVECVKARCNRCSIKDQGIGRAVRSSLAVRAKVFSEVVAQIKRYRGKPGRIEITTFVFVSRRFIQHRSANRIGVLLYGWRIVVESDCEGACRILITIVTVFRKIVQNHCRGAGFAAACCVQNIVFQRYRVVAIRCQRNCEQHAARTGCGQRISAFVPSVIDSFGANLALRAVQVCEGDSATVIAEIDID